MPSTGPTTRTCPACSALFSPTARICPICKLEVSKMEAFAAAKQAAAKKGFRSTAVVIGGAGFFRRLLRPIVSDTRLLSRFLILGAAASALLVGIPASIGETSPTDPVVRVEEDWQLVLNDPDSLVRAPQFHTVMSPFPDLNSYYAMVIWNYRELPEFTAGGLQIQDWNGERQLGQVAVGDRRLSTRAETITWTQRLRTSGTTVLFDIVNGHSETWGSFGDGMQICQSAGVTDLASYSTNVSTENSWITYGANRVDRLVISQVRRFHQSGAVTVDTTEKVVYTHQDQGVQDQAPDPPSEDD